MATIIDSSDDIQIYNDDKNFRVFAGPGAGKTYFVINNIKEIIKNSSKLKLDNNRRICCITYTNVAADEIRRRLGNFNSYVHVSTIHSFLHEFVIKDNQLQLKLLIKEICDIEVPKRVQFYPRQEGFGLLAKLELTQLLEKIRDYGVNIKVDEKTNKKIFEDAVLNIKSLENYDDKLKQIKLKQSDNFSNEALLKIKKAIWSLDGVLDFDEILYFSLLLIKNYRQIIYSIRYLFPYFLIDEYQDTVKIQNEIFHVMGQSSSVSIGVIGDAAQSIYGFADANYRDFLNFNLICKNFNTYVINNNRRSNQNIVHFLNHMRIDDANLQEQLCVTNEGKEKVHFLLCAKDPSMILPQLPEDTIVLCRRWTDAFIYINGLTSEQKQKVQQIHAFSTYAAGRNLFEDFENGKLKWVAQIKFIVDINKAIEAHDFSSILNECSKIFDINGIIKPNKNQVLKLKQLKSFVEKMKKLESQENYFDMIKYINLEAENCGLTILNTFEIMGEDDPLYEELYFYLNELKYNTLKKMVEEIFVKEGKYVTIHKTKGKEYNSVLVSLETAYYDNSQQIIQAMATPHIFVDEKNQNEWKWGEFQRIAYVAFSRAKNNLYIHVKNNMKAFAPVESALAKYMIENNINEKFYDIIDLNN